MEVNDYIRTKWGDIERIVRVDNDDIIVEIEEDEDGRTYSKMCYKEDIIKSSPNIIDIIEVGDYVNGCKIIELTTNIDGKVLYLETDITEFDNVYACGHINIYKNDIRTIVTKEQFKNIEYEVK